MTRVIGFLFSSLIAALLAWVSVAWADIYIASYRNDVPIRPEYFGPIYQILFAALGGIIGFTLASLIYRQAIDFWSHLLSDISSIPARDKLAAVIGMFLGMLKYY